MLYKSKRMLFLSATLNILSPQTLSLALNIFLRPVYEAMKVELMAANLMFE